MKSIDILCASQTSTSIRLAMDDHEPSSPSPPPSSTLLSRSPAIDRHNPIITDSRRTIPPPTTSRSPPRHLPSKPHIKIPHKKKKKKAVNQKKVPPRENSNNNDDDDDSVKKNNWSCTEPAGAFISPPGSTRYLLSENDNLPDFGPARKASPPENPEPVANGYVEKSPSSDQDQAVVLRVSLHCRGCERKMRKHISRMEGVTSFNIDFAAKKVTVMGKITPLEVLSSISKVKYAQLLSPTISSSPPPPPTLMSNSQINNDYYKGAGA